MYEENALLQQDQELYIALTLALCNNYYSFLLGILKIYNPCIHLYRDCHDLEPVFGKNNRTDLQTGGSHHWMHDTVCVHFIFLPNSLIL